MASISKIYHNEIDVTIENLELVKGVHKYGLNATFIKETAQSIEEVTIKNIELPIDTKGIIITRDRYGEIRADIGYGMNPAADVTVKVLKEKTVEVTMEEIEKKFGCKVKIVKEKN